MQIVIKEESFFGGWTIQDSDGNRLINILFKSKGIAARYAKTNFPECKEDNNGI